MWGRLDKVGGVVGCGDWEQPHHDHFDTANHPSLQMIKSSYMLGIPERFGRGMNWI